MTWAKIFRCLFPGNIRELLRVSVSGTAASPGGGTHPPFAKDRCELSVERKGVAEKSTPKPLPARGSCPCPLHQENLKII